jgi:hypothetical protein
MGRRQDSVAHFKGAVGLLSDAQVMRYYDQAMTLPALKAERPSLAGVQSQALQNVAVRIDFYAGDHFLDSSRSESIPLG